MNINIKETGEDQDRMGARRVLYTLFSNVCKAMPEEDVPRLSFVESPFQLPHGHTPTLNCNIFILLRRGVVVRSLNTTPMYAVWGNSP